MNRQTIRSTIKNYLSQQEEVVFAYIFGSFANGELYRDIDTAIYTESEPDLIKLGTMQTELCGRTGEDIDLIYLNGLPDKNPAFAYEIVTYGELLLNTNPLKHTGYKRKALLYYFDTARLRDKVDRAFDERLKSNRFGLRNYV